MTRQELIEMAKKNYSFAEILKTREFTVKKREPLRDGSGETVVWRLEKSNQIIEILTSGENDPCIVLNEALLGFEKLEKYDLIKILHTGDEWRFAESIVESGTPLFRGPLAAIGNMFKEEDLALEGESSSEDKYLWDVAFNAAVNRKRKELEATAEAKRQLEEIEAQRISAQYDAMSPEERAEHLGLINWDQLWADTSIERWFVPNFICEGRAHSFYAASGLGKSLLMLEVSAYLAKGWGVFGYEAQAPIKVLYVDNENTPKGDVKPRLKAMGFESGDLENLLYLSFPDLAPLNTKAGGETFKKMVEEFKPELVVLDTFSRFLEGDENLAQTAQTFYNWTGKFLKKSGIAYVRIDHMGKNSASQVRGTSAKKDDVDLVWLLEEVEAGKKFEMVNEKARVPIQLKTYLVERLEAPLHHKVINGIDWGPLLEYLEKENQALKLIEDFAKDNPGSKLGRKAVWDSLRELCSEEKITRERIWVAIDRYKDGERSMSVSVHLEE
jgi:RecA-family ATPase